MAFTFSGPAIWFKGVYIMMRRKPAADWTSENPVLREGEPGLESDTGQYKIGDGSSTWTSLSYASTAGAAATIAVGTVDTVPFGDPATVTNSGSSSAAVFDFEIPAGENGADGADGAAATIAVGDVDTVDPGDPATVTNSGSSSAAVFDFEIPRGLTSYIGPVDGGGPDTVYTGSLDVDGGQVS